MSEHTNDPLHNSFLDIKNGRSGKNMPQKFSSRNESHNSILYDAETIMGGMENLKKIIELSRSKNPKRKIMVHCCCTPIVIGDDVSSFVRSLSRKSGCSAAYNDVTLNESQDKFLPVYKKNLDILQDDKKIPKSINLVGFPKNQSQQEIIEMLEIAGISINKKILPEISKDYLRGYRASDFQVLFPNILYSRIYSELFLKTGVPSISPPPPYGFRLTTGWIKSVCKSLKIDLEENKEWKNACGALIQKYEKLKKESCKYRLGLVVSKFDMPRLLNPELYFNSVPLLALLEDMGFSLDILIYSGKGEYLDFKDQIKKILDCREKHSIRYCFDLDELECWLKRDDICAVFSDYRFDQRISRHSKNRFSLSINFELGYKGAIRSLERMMEVCRFQFNRKYSGFFSGAMSPIEIRGGEFA
jgi:hypothetical protein